MGRLLAIDYGLKRTGIAITDPLKMIAIPHLTIPTPTILDWLKNYLKSEPVDVFVMGWPTNTDGQPTDTTPHVAGMIKRLQHTFPDIPVVKIDERFTSVIAQRSLIATGVSKKIKQNKGIVDQVSAAIILQSYMEKYL